MRFLIQRSMNSYNSFIGLFLISGLMLMGCAVTPKPVIDVLIEPIEGQTNTSIDPQTGAVTIEQKGVAVTIEHLDEIQMFSLTEDPHINPYLVVKNDGNVEPIYTVFLLTVRNIDTPRVLVEESAQLIDRNGAQYANLPFNYFEQLYDTVTSPEQNQIQPRVTPQYHPYRPYHRTYLDTGAMRAGQEFAAESLFESGKLFKGAKRSGLIIFDRLNRDTTDLRIIVTDVSIVHSDEKQETLKFNFDFRQVVVER